MHNKAKEDMMKEKTKPKEAKPTKESSMENKLAKRIANGNKLIDNFKQPRTLLHITIRYYKLLSIASSVS